EEAKQLADQLELPIISCSYDTFTVGSMINRAIDDRLIKKEIILVEDVSISIDSSHYLYTDAKVEKRYGVSEETNHTRFPVVNGEMKVQGMVTAKDIMGHLPSVQIDKAMTKDPICVTDKTSVASAAHEMVWEGIELLPVVNEHRVLKGIISRQD